MKRNYSIVCNVDRCTGNNAQERAQVLLKNILITDRDGVHNYEIGKYLDNNSCVIAWAFFIAKNNGYKTPRLYKEFNTYWFTDIRILETGGDLHNYPVSINELLTVFGFTKTTLNHATIN